MYSSAVFRPAKEKSRPSANAWCRAPRPPRERSAGEPGNENASGSPPAASRSSAGAAGVAEPEHPRALVERLAGGVVERAPEHLEAVVLR